MPRSTSDVWQFYQKIGKSEVQCNLCGKTQRYSGGTSNLRGHLERSHPSFFGIPKSPTITKFARSNTCPTERSKKITKMLVQFLANDMRPLNLVQVSIFVE